MTSENEFHLEKHVTNHFGVSRPFLKESEKCCRDEVDRRPQGFRGVAAGNRNRVRFGSGIRVGFSNQCRLDDRRAFPAETGSGLEDRRRLMVMEVLKKGLQFKWDSDVTLVNLFLKYQYPRVRVDYSHTGVTEWGVPRLLFERPSKRTFYWKAEKIEISSYSRFPFC